MIRGDTLLVMSVKMHEPGRKSQQVKSPEGGLESRVKHMIRGDILFVT